MEGGSAEKFTHYNQFESEASKRSQERGDMDQVVNDVFKDYLHHDRPGTISTLIMKTKESIVKLIPDLYSRHLSDSEKSNIKLILESLLDDRNRKTPEEVADTIQEFLKLNQ